MQIECSGVMYSVEVRGNGEPLLMLHGFTGDHTTWESVVDVLQDNYMCIVPDIIGHGKSDSPDEFSRYSLEKVTADLKHILAVLNIEQCHILGYSMGGRLALQFGILFKEHVKTLLLESASPGLALAEEREQRKLQDHRLADRIEREGIKSFVEYWGDIPLFQSQQKLPPSIRKAIFEQRMRNNETGLANSLRGMGTGSQQSLWKELSEVHFPVLLVTGELDEKFCGIAERMSSKLINCEWQILNNVGHAIHVEDSEMFGRIVSGFIEKWKERDYGNQLGTRT